MLPSLLSLTPVLSVRAAPPQILYTSAVFNLVIAVQDDDGLHYTPGKCDCDFELAEAIIDIIAEGLEQLSLVLVSVLLQTMKNAPKSYKVSQLPF